MDGSVCWAVHSYGWPPLLPGVSRLPVTLAMVRAVAPTTAPSPNFCHMRLLYVPTAPAPPSAPKVTTVSFALNGWTLWTGPPADRAVTYVRYLFLLAEVWPNT